MRRAVPLLTAWILAWAWLLPARAAAQTRATPTRPGASPAQPLAAPSPHHPLGAVNVDLVDAAERFGIEAVASGRGKKLALAFDGSRIDFELNSREVQADGLRVFMGGPMISRRGHLYISRVDFDAVVLPLLRPARATPPPPRPRVIAIDAGHGGGDNGMQNEALGLKEKTLALDVALRLKKILETAGFKIVLTRTDDRTFSTEKKKDLPMRAQVANRAGADVFVSLHFNSLFPDTKTSGTEVYVYTRRGQRSDTSMGFGEEDDSRTEAAAVNRFDAWSTILAHRIHQSVISQLKTNDRGQKTKHLLVLQDLECPAVLVESVFLSNPVEARRAATPAYRQQIAAAIADGLRDYAALFGSSRSKP